MESELEQDHSIQADVRPVSRFLRFLLASIATLVLGGVILGVARATGMLVGVYERWFPVSSYCSLRLLASSPPLIRVDGSPAVAMLSSWRRLVRLWGACATACPQDG